MKVVLDTNVVVSGLLSPFGAPGEIVRMVASGTLEPCYDARILSEDSNVLLRQKFPFDKLHINLLLDQIKTCGHLVAAEPLPKSLPDPDDEPFLEAAIAGKAQYLVTGNPKHYPSKRRQGIAVILPIEFLEICRKKLNI